MKRVAHIGRTVQIEIIRQYKEKDAEGNYVHTLQKIANDHEVSLSTVNNLARIAKCQGRPRGGKVKRIAGPRIMKILRDASELGITLEEVGRRNPRIVDLERYLSRHCLSMGELKRRRPDAIISNGKVQIPLTKQRVSEIISTWRAKLNEQSIKSRGFKKDDIIEWAGQRYTVVRYHNSHRGAVIDQSDNRLIDPFCWFYKGSRSKLVERDGKPVDTMRDGSANPRTAYRAANKR